MEANNRADPQDVYRNFEPGERDAPTGLEAVFALTLESAPTSLTRAFSLLGTLNMVPAETRSWGFTEDLLQLEITVESESSVRLDLLLRKFQQMTECLDASLTERPLIRQLPRVASG